MLAFIGTFLLSLFVALLAALQLSDHFRATDEFVAVMFAVTTFALAAIVLFAVTYAAARSKGAITAMAWLLLVGACVLVTVPDALALYRGRRLDELTFGLKDVQVMLGFLVPALLVVLVQWGLVRRRWLRVRGMEELSRWPWFTTAVAALAILNPIGLDWIEAGLRRPADWSLRQTQALGTIAAAVAVIVPAAVEYYIRDRMLRRRLNASPDGAKLPAAG
jgi:hypothetical protein